MKALIAPVSEVATGWGVAGAVAIDIEDEAIVGADPNRAAGRGGASFRVRRKCKSRGSRSGVVVRVGGSTGEAGWTVDGAWEWARAAEARAVQTRNCLCTGWDLS